MTEKDFPLRLRGRGFTLAALGQIRAIIARRPSENRAAISREICAHLNWRQPNGALKDAACRYVLLKLHRAGLITLPPPRRSAPRLRPIPPSPQTDPQFPLTGSAGQLGQIELLLVTGTAHGRLFREYLDRYHYLGHPVIVGPQLRYLIHCRQGVLGAIAFAAAAWKVAPRDKWIGWDHPTRERNLRYVINNVRFLILPWVQSRNLASRILAHGAKQVPEDWQKLYGYRPVLFETFVEKRRFQGTSYKAANWLYVGDTQGRGKNDRFNQNFLPLKAIYLYPLSRDPRQDLCRVHA